MRLTTKGRYAVMALADRAILNGGRPVARADIADREDISLSYLEQLFAKLRRRGRVRSVRGPGGGYVLARDPAETIIADILLAADEPPHATRCDPGSPEGRRMNRSRCLTHELWDALSQEIRRFLPGVPLAEVVDGRLADRHTPLDAAAE